MSLVSDELYDEKKSLRDIHQNIKDKLFGQRYKLYLEEASNLKEQKDTIDDEILRLERVETFIKNISKLKIEYFQAKKDLINNNTKLQSLLDKCKIQKDQDAQNAALDAQRKAEEAVALDAQRKAEEEAVAAKIAEKQKLQDIQSNFNPGISSGNQLIVEISNLLPDQP